MALWCPHFVEHVRQIFPVKGKRFVIFDLGYHDFLMGGVAGFWDRRKSIHCGGGGYVRQ
jgi:hypothetical protein